MRVAIRTVEGKSKLLASGVVVDEDGGDVEGVRSGLDPCEVLDGEFGGGGVGIEPEDGRQVEVEEDDAALAIAGG
ncbi:hypothetical protein ACFX1T_045673 [Malus domestica]